MSFTLDVKKELIKHFTKPIHCRLAELAAAVLFNGAVVNGCYEVAADNEDLAKKYTVSFRKAFGVEAEFCERPELSTARKKLFAIRITDSAAEEKIGAFKELFDWRESLLAPEAEGENKTADLKSLTKSNGFLQKSCCRRAFLRSAFLAAGAISDPQKNYHFEIRCPKPDLAECIRNVIESFDLHARISRRRDRYIVYIKEGVEIADMLNIIEAHVALMNYENARIIREMRGNVNRKVNCETANIEKTINAAMKQIEDIIYIRDTIGLQELTGGLEKIAAARLENPDMPLSALGEQLDPPVGKSGVNHRLRKISQIAEQLRKQSVSECNPEEE